MNLMGKIFTLLIFFMSICFLVVAVMVGATHRNWKAQAAELRSIADQKTQIAEAAVASTTEKDKLLTAERVSRAQQLAQLESQLKIVNDQYRDKEKQLLEQLKISQDQLQSLKTAQAQLTAQDKEVADLKLANAKLAAEIADKFSLVRNLTNQRFELQNQLDSIKGLNQDLSANLAVKTKVMNSNGLADDDLTDHIVPKLDVVVTKVADQRDLIAIAAGTDDGVRVGHEFSVYRQNRYIGKVRVSKTDFNVSIARVIDDFMQDTVQEGDHVTSKF